MRFLVKAIIKFFTLSRAQQLKVLAALLLFAGLVLVNYLASSLPVRLDATAGKIYTLTPGTRAILAGVAETITLDLYFSRDADGMPVQVVNYADHVADMLREYARASHGKITVNIINPRPDSPDDEAATKSGLEPVNNTATGADPAYFGLVATQADQRAALPGFSLQREQLLEYDLSQLIYTVQHAADDKKKLGLITSLPLMGQPFDMMTGRPSPGQYVGTQWEKLYSIVTVAPDADKLPDNLDVLAIIHPQNLSPKLQFAIDQFLLSGKKVFLALDPASQFFKRQAGQQQMMMGGPQPNVSSDLPVLLKAYGVAYDPQTIIGDLDHPLPRRNPRTGGVVRDPTWLMLDRDSASPASPATAQLKSFWFVESGGLAFTPASGVTVTPLIETSAQSGDLQSMMLQFTPPDEIARSLKPVGKRTIAALVEGKLKTAFPDGPPKDPATPPDAPKPADNPNSKIETPKPLTESSTKSILLIVADTDWLFDELIFDSQARQQGYLVPQNDNLDFAANALDFLSGSTDLLSVRGKGSSFRPFKVVQDMETAARKQYQTKLDAIEARLNEVQTKLSGLQAKKTEGGRLVASPEMVAEIEKFQKDQRAIAREQREIKRDLSTDINALGRRLLWFNLLTTPLLVGAFGLWFRLRRR